MASSLQGKRDKNEPAAAAKSAERRTLRVKIDELLKRFRLPERQFEALIEDLEGRVEEARSACSLVVADMKRLRSEIASHESAADEAQAAARRALEQGREDLARSALARKIAHGHSADKLRADLGEMEKESENLARDLEELACLVDEAKRRRNLLRAKSKLAGSKGRARRRKGDDEAMLLDDDIERAFQELEKKDLLDRELDRLKGSKRRKG
ncbi:MAG: PspA/IM30 family protein [Planctomycetota bacterium]